MKSKKMKIAESKAHQNDGRRLSLIRRKNRKTQAEFAVEFQVSVGTIGNYERGLTEMPPSFWRAVNEGYGLNPTPLNPEESPERLLQVPEVPQPKEESCTPRAVPWKLARLRTRYKIIRNQIYSPKRRFVEGAVHTVFFAATFVFLVEQAFRALPVMHEDPSVYRDIVFVTAFMVMSVLLIPVFQSLPWGLKVNDDGDFGEV
ncbi:helix-turn-helix transcriptional regulator [Ruegeria sp. R13_0]|uniref:helix-turn-helix domain-containing protein n=1 Tax=Ruegeria sp. R13_0 TaxID=2821099 RepID=UPI001AD9DAFA|nr:helix-turn-helix transcriptional regulator [Ruegeria sp. R13_0]MBO9434038.1 helix-turn-helix transcriptional regulator [Ruegeria sp. R13_0]